MKYVFYVKITMLFLLVLFVFSFLIIDIKENYVESKTKERVDNVINMIKDIKEEQESAIGINDCIGMVLIPALDIEAPIYEGTTSDVLKYSVGHFEETSLWEGNVVLASHNRGSYAHYFSRINELKNGEEIIYITNMGERRYRVTESKIIEETNVSVLKNTEENTITLITCITDKKDKRRCVIGKEYD